MLASPTHVGTKDVESFTNAFPYCKALWFVRARRETSSPEQFPAQKALRMASLMAEELDTLQLYLYPHGENETATTRSLDLESLSGISKEADQAEETLAEPLYIANVRPEEGGFGTSTAQAFEETLPEDPLTGHIAAKEPSEDKYPKPFDLDEPVLEAVHSDGNLDDTGDPIEAAPFGNASYTETTRGAEEVDNIAPRDDPEEDEVALDAKADSTGHERTQTEASDDSGSEASVMAIEETETLPNTERKTLANADEGGNELQVNSQGEVAPDANQKDDLSKYDDEHMPHSFLWWLHKTRIAYSATYQPYASTKEPERKDVVAKRPGETVLDQQMKEHIFHLQAPEDKLQAQPQGTVQNTTFRIAHGADDIIDRFIREEPQITPPKPEKINLENKARKSAEDQSVFVSETLANVYTEQGLYQRAIDTYLKLSLKYPEKSAYFADRINELKKKTN